MRICRFTGPMVAVLSPRATAVLLQRSRTFWGTACRRTASAGSLRWPTRRARRCPRCRRIGAACCRKAHR